MSYLNHRLVAALLWIAVAASAFGTYLSNKNIGHYAQEQRAFVSLHEPVFPGAELQALETFCAESLKLDCNKVASRAVTDRYQAVRKTGPAYHELDQATRWAMLLAFFTIILLCGALAHLDECWEELKEPRTVLA